MRTYTPTPLVSLSNSLLCSPEFTTWPSRSSIEYLCFSFHLIFLCSHTLFLGRNKVSTVWTGIRSRLLRPPFPLLVINLYPVCSTVPRRRLPVASLPGFPLPRCFMFPFPAVNSKTCNMNESWITYSCVLARLFSLRSSLFLF
jgi:hypothetical protein